MKNNNKSKPKQNKNRKPRTRNNNNKKKTLVINRTNGNKPSIPKSFVSQVCSQINPFCPEAIGGKIHDLSSEKTLTLTSRLIYDVQSDAAGSACFLIRGTSVDPLYQGVISGGLLSGYMTAEPCPQYAALTGQAATYRTVSCGARFLPTANLMTVQGFMIASELNTAPAVGASINSTSLSNVVMTRAIAGEPLMWISRPTDLEYTDFKGWNDTSVGGQRTQLFLSFNGFETNAPIGLIEVVLNFEIIANNNTVASYFPTTAAPANPVVMETASNVMRKVDPFFVGPMQDFDKMITDEVRQFGGTLIRTGGKALSNYVMSSLLA